MISKSTVARCVAVTTLIVGATAATVPQALAADEPMNAEVSNTAVEAGKSLGRLGPLADLVITRLKVSDDVAASKFGTDSPIDDPAREQQVLEQVRKQASALGLDPISTTAFFQDQITASKVVQKGLFARWAAHPDEAPTTRPDLGQIRTKLDQLTTDLLSELKTTVPLRNKRITCTIELVVAAGSGAVFDNLDTLHRQALNVAVHSACTNLVG
ncbi:chorismate mutase [Amycolatopsis sp. NPDC005232]|uniref:chorismate mutase n=1 Tax=Amycolatopsis sp. NPDC005232 TaxID=3157027 RepID=UPI0033A3C369